MNLNHGNLLPGCVYAFSIIFGVVMGLCVVVWTLRLIFE